MATNKAIEMTYPNRKEWNEMSMKKWLHSYHEIRNVVETVLNLQDEYDKETQQTMTSYRCTLNTTYLIFSLIASYRCKTLACYVKLLL